MNRPNVLLVVMDAVRADYVSAYGYHRPTTPYLDSLVDDGVLFQQAFATAPWTPPSHASLFTGLYPSRHGVDVGENLVLGAGNRTLAEILAAEGYATFGLLPDVHLSGIRGFDRGFQERVELWRLPYLHRDPAWLACLAWNACHGRDRRTRYSAHVVSRFIAEHARRPEPFFAFVNFKTAHAPYHRLPAAHRRRWEQQTGQGDRTRPAERRLAERYSLNGGYSYMAGRLAVEATEMELVRSWYAADIAYLDRALGSLLGTLRETGAADDTLVIVTADHGEHFGENGLAYHLFSLSDVLLHVPLVMSCPRHLPRARRVGGLVSLVDVLPTIAEIVGLDLRDLDLQGRSLAAFDATCARAEVFAEFGRPYYMLKRLASKFPDHDFSRFDRGLSCIRTNGWKLVVGDDGGEALHDLRADPLERRNAAAEQPDVVADLRTRLDAWRASMGAVRAGAPAEEDAVVVKALEELGYF